MCMKCKKEWPHSEAEAAKDHDCHSRLPLPPFPKNRTECNELIQSKWWNNYSNKEIVQFQLYTPWLCMDYDHFLIILCEVLGRPVFKHEFAHDGGKVIIAEFEGKCQAPTWNESMQNCADREYAALSPERKWLDYLKNKPQ